MSSRRPGRRGLRYHIAHQSPMHDMTSHLPYFDFVARQLSGNLKEAHRSHRSLFSQKLIKAYMPIF